MYGVEINLYFAPTGSPLIHYRVFGKETIVLNTLKAATDLLESRASIYSDRPHFVMYQELMNRKHSMFHLTSQSPRFKIYRRMLQSSLNPRAVQKYRGIQRDERVILLKGLLNSPEQFVSHLRRYVLGPHWLSIEVTKTDNNAPGMPERSF